MSRRLEPGALAQLDQEMANLKELCGLNNIPWTIDALRSMHFILDSVLFALEEKQDLEIVIDVMHDTVEAAERFLEVDDDPL